MVAEAADEYLAQLHCGETPDLSDYARCYPQVASVLPQVLPVLEMTRGYAITWRGSSSAAFRIVREIPARAVELAKADRSVTAMMDCGPENKELSRFKAEAVSLIGER